VKPASWRIAQKLRAAFKEFRVGERNHPFIDGNKRIGFVAGVLFLELNGDYAAFLAAYAVKTGP
jgi:prophage maintenance system killer protein